MSKVLWTHSFSHFDLRICDVPRPHCCYEVDTEIIRLSDGGEGTFCCARHVRSQHSRRTVDNKVT